jgi:hypothetical protein
MKTLLTSTFALALLAAGCASSEQSTADQQVGSAALVSDAATIDSAEVACVAALSSHYQSISNPQIRDRRTTIEQSNYVTRGTVDVFPGPPRGPDRYRFTCTTSPMGGQFSSVVSASEQIIYATPPEPTTVPGSSMADAENTFTAAIVTDFRRSDDPSDLIRTAKLACVNLLGGKSVEETGLRIQAVHPEWSTEESGALVGMAIGAFCPDQKYKLPS